MLNCFSLLLCICSSNPWVLSSCVGSAAECHLQLLKRQVYLVARFYSDQTFLSLCHRRHVAALCMLHKVNSNYNPCLFSELPSVSVRVRHTWAVAEAHPLKFEVSRCRTSQFARCFLLALTRVWNDLPYTVFDTGTLDGFKGAVKRWMLSWDCFSVFCGRTSETTATAVTSATSAAADTSETTEPTAKWAGNIKKDSARLIKVLIGWKEKLLHSDKEVLN